jgi:protein-disulfide isomerase
MPKLPTRWPLLFPIALLTLGTVGFICADAAKPPAAAEAAPPVADQGTELLGARTKGRPDAPIMVVEMSDFQCPYCRAFATETWATLEREYVATGQVKWIFINFPLTEIHPNAVAAAELAMCAAKQGKFWPMHDLLFAHQAKWAPLREPGQLLLTFADSLRIPRDSILPCVQNGEMRGLVQKDANTAARIGARSTPSFLIEGAMLSGAYPADVFRHVLDSIYTVKTAGPAGR